MAERNEVEQQTTVTMKFIYLGEVDVHQNNLCNFISAAKNLEFHEIVKAVKEARNEIVESIKKYKFQK